MDNLLTRLHLSFLNIKNVRNVNKKEELLNSSLGMIYRMKPVADAFNSIYEIDPNYFKYLKSIELGYLVMLSYDLKLLSREINLDSTYYLVYEGQFKILSTIFDESLSDIFSEPDCDLPTDTIWSDV